MEESGLAAERKLHGPPLRQTFDLARSAVAKGNHPFGSLLLSEDGQTVLATAENCVNTANDITRHAELVLISEVSGKLDAETIRKATLYASTEPCMMCTGALFWLGVRKVVYACAQETLNSIVSAELGKAGTECVTMHNPIRDMLGRAKGFDIEIVGPVLEEEAVRAHHDYWPSIFNPVSEPATAAVVTATQPKEIDADSFAAKFDAEWSKREASFKQSILKEVQAEVRRELDERIKLDEGAIDAACARLAEALKQTLRVNV
eukprot:TRINITY_DN3511_c0_g2_i2.p1 TRINITY_DN3511_c0_g2~~TRINITY_DN3511_c0_g2_i2.p1  ORF type:complete len:262 (+),score=87.81 TRINITY_DN3511_c0_g2_i2:294-1079(+)